jgi:UDPglucose 6-dehydrogenase
MLKPFVKVVVYEPLAKGDEIKDVEFINDFSDFSKRADIIVANRVDENLERVKEKVLSRDIFSRD